MSATSTKHVAFCGGGSGGHLIPAVATSEELLRSNSDACATFIFSSRPIDDVVLASVSQDPKRIQFVKQSIASSSGRLQTFWHVAKAFLRCRRQFLRSRPNVAVGLGGFASVPGVLAAAWLGIPVILLETNRIVGRANRFLSRFAERMICGWPLEQGQHDSLPLIPEHFGVPVRREFQPSDYRSSDRLRLLVLGGSQGAKRLNELIRNALHDSSWDVPFDVTHQTGGVGSTTKSIPSDNVQWVEVPFIEDVAEAIRCADLVVCRCGALTLAEVASIGRPCVLIPLSTSAEDHQLRNAEWFAQNDAGVIVDESSGSSATELREVVSSLLRSSERRSQMAESARRLVRQDSISSFTDAILSLADSAERRAK